MSETWSPSATVSSDRALMAITLSCSLRIRSCDGRMPALSNWSHVSMFSSYVRHVSGTTSSSEVGRTVGSSMIVSALPRALEYSPILIRAS